jgi:5-methylthioribose kinase
MPTPTHGASSVPVVASRNNARGRVYHVLVVEAEDAPHVVLCMFFVNATFVVVLFYYGASHSFIFVAYVEKHNLPIALLKCQMIVNSQGGDMAAR